MIRSDFVKRSVLQGVTAVITPVHRFHSTSKTLARSVFRKNCVNVSEGKHLETGIDHLTANKSSNINFLGIESEEGVITVKSTANSVQQNILQRNVKEKFYRTSFGIIRNDCDNTLKFHGQYGNTYDFDFPRTNSNDYSIVSVDSSKTCNNFEINKLNYSVKNPKISEENKHTRSNVDASNKESSDLHAVENDDQSTSYIDQYYFNSSYTDERGHLVQNVSDTQLSEELNFIDKNYFKDSTVSESQKHNFPQNPYLVKEVDAEYSNKFFSENLKSNYTDNEELISKQNNTEVSTKCNERELFQDIFCNVNTIATYDRKHVDIAHSSKNIKAKQFNTEKNGVKVKSGDDSVDTGVNFLHNVNHSQSEDSIKPNTKLNISSEKDISGNHLSRTKKLFPSAKGSKHSKLYSEESVDVTDARAIDFVKNLQKKVAEQESVDVADARAVDFVKNLQKQKKVAEDDIKNENEVVDLKVDTKGFRILKCQVEDLSNFTRDEIINLLKQNILYSDDNLLILNKPYSLVMHESQTTRSPCLSAFVDELANELRGQGNNPKIYTVHRLDKETTGCLLLARNELMAQNLKSLFAQRKIIKKYWILTSRVPDPPEGIIDIPVAEGSVDNKKRMVLHPEIPKDLPYRNHSKRGKQAVTSYKVISESGNAALVEATPLTGIKHQIRVHFGFGLCCPILGDHKYSHLDKLAPQKLPSDLLQRLHVRQSKVRYIPLHIHAKSVTIPGYFEGQDLYVKAPLPKHMKENLKRLKFKK